jgi:hypothetical protein
LRRRWKKWALPPEDQDAIASENLDSLADEEAWKGRFASRRDRLRQLAQEALDEDDRGETCTLADLFRSSRGLLDGLGKLLRNYVSDISAQPKPPKFAFKKLKALTGR